FFFFQAEDGIRDGHVTGVQTCALPILAMDEPQIPPKPADAQMLAMATIWASAGFGGICGSSIATAATFAKVAYPSMKKFGYSDRDRKSVVEGKSVEIGGSDSSVTAEWI